MHDSWWEAVRELPESDRFVAHEPETPRYGLARQKLKYLIRKGEYLGATDASADEGRIEIAIWAPSIHGRGPGYYACFRLFIEDGGATCAVLFCFYDGTESSPAFSTLQEAQLFAQMDGFVREDSDEIQD